MADLILVRPMLPRAYVLLVLAASLVASSCTTEIQTVNDCDRCLLPGDIESIRAVVMSRSDVRKPVFQIRCEDHNHVTVASGPQRSNAIVNSIKLVRRHGTWHVISISEGPLVIIVGWIMPRPNQAMQPTASPRTASVSDD